MSARAVSRLRDVRVVAGRVPLAAGGSGAFARAVIARHWRRVVDPHPLGVTFARPGFAPMPGAAPAIVDRRIALTMAPRLQLSIAVRSGAAADATPRSSGARDMTVAAAPGATVVSRAERLVERLGDRGVRVPPRPTAAAPPAAPPQRAERPAPGPADLALPVPAVVARPAGAVPAAAARAGASAAGMAAPAAATAAVGPAAGPLGAPVAAAPELDLARVTDAVIASIDRRVIAESERMGAV